MVARRIVVITAVFLVSTLAIYHFLPWTPHSSWPSVISDGRYSGISSDATSETGASNGKNTAARPAEALNYFDQVFSVNKPAAYDFPGLRQYCASTQWREDDVYLTCGGTGAGLTSIISELKVCLKMAVETGSNLILPSMPLRDSTDLNEYNMEHPDKFLTFDQWFDADHFVSNMGKACPKMKIIHPKQLETHEVPVKTRFNVSLAEAKGYHFPDQYFWVGRPFRTFFEEQYTKIEANITSQDPAANYKNGITVVGVHAAFLLFRITDDPTRRDLALWNDLSLLIRFNQGPRQIIDRVLARMNRPFYGVHFRVEKDAIWSPLEHQLTVDLNSLDAAWTKFGQPGAQKPLIYLACGDSHQVEKFVEAGAARGWEVTHKWALAKEDPETLAMINELAFDFQGAVDFGVMVKSEFFFGITGSAFSATVSNARDATGRYRGSSLSVHDDGGARTHLTQDIDAQAYPCCL
jgi:hypothetical protein